MSHVDTGGVTGSGASPVRPGADDLPPIGMYVAAAIVAVGDLCLAAVIASGEGGNFGVAALVAVVLSAAGTAAAAVALLSAARRGMSGAPLSGWRAGLSGVVLAAVMVAGWVLAGWLLLEATGAGLLLTAAVPVVAGGVAKAASGPGPERRAARALFIVGVVGALGLGIAVLVRPTDAEEESARRALEARLAARVADCVEETGAVARGDEEEVEDCLDAGETDPDSGRWDCQIGLCTYQPDTGWSPFFDLPWSRYSTG